MAEREKKKKPVVVEEPAPAPEKIRDETMESIMGERYATYAKYVIQDRAIPDARDGLKPVQRRIIYSMWKQGNVHSRPTRKCARIVGDVIGKYHPHGDASIYDALVRMSQDWKNNAPLIDFQGNNGSIDGDPPAAYRYTESRLSEISEELTRDLDEDTVEMTLTFDDTELEPTVLPARFPNLLVNGAEGIAVALATEIPPHNLGEVIDALIYRIGHPLATSEDLLKFVLGPDFPTGGLIYDSQGLKDIYLKGRGRIETAARSEIVDDGEKKQIVITEIPYKVVKIALVYELDKLRHDRLLTGISEVRDESDRFGMRIVVELRKEANSAVIQKYLLSKTSLRSAFSANMVAIVNGRPKTMTLLDFVDCYLDHQVLVITRKSGFELKKAEGRLRIVEGLIRAIGMLDEIVKTIRAAKDKVSAKLALEKKYGFADDQSEAIVMLQLYKLTSTDVSILVKEKKTLEKNIAFLQGILSDEKKLHHVLIRDLREIKRKYARPRRSQIVPREEERLTAFERRDLIARTETVVAVTRDGYLKRSTPKSYKGSGEGALPGMKEGDALVYAAPAMTTDALVCFTNRGNYLYLPVYQLFENKWKQEGKHASTLVSLLPEEKIVRAFAVEEFKPGLFILLVTRLGQIKRLALPSLVLSRYSRPVSCMKLLGDDEVLDAAFTDGAMNVLLVTSDGNASLFPESDVSVATLKSGGNKAMAHLYNSAIGAMLVFPKEESKGRVILVTDKGCARVFDLASVKLGKRLGKQTLLFRSLKKDRHRLVALRKVVNKETPTGFRFLNGALQSVAFRIGDYKLTPLDHYARRNVDIKGVHRTRLVHLFYEDGLRITKDIESRYVPPPVKEPEEESALAPEAPEGEEETYTQGSLFDAYNGNGDGNGNHGGDGVPEASEKPEDKAGEAPGSGGGDDESE